MIVYNLGGKAIINYLIVSQALENAVVDSNECDSSGYIAGNVILKKINNRTERALSEEMKHEFMRQRLDYCM